MATNKHASIRYIALNKCFSNFGRMYFIEDLVEECNKALYEYSGLTDGVKKRQVYEDINFIQSEQGWSAPIEKFKNGRNVYYRYSDPNFSISSKPVSYEEAKQLKEALGVLTRFKGMPQFEWVDELDARINHLFKISESGKVIEFEQNQFLEGINYFADIFNFILNKRVVTVEYRGFKQLSNEKITIHPYFLKQYNTRWFLFGFNEKYSSLTNMALDRIISFSEQDIPYRECEIDFDEYFEDVIGVTVPADSSPERIVLKVSDTLFPYLKSKPMHGSQKVRNVDGVNYLELNVAINYELKSLLLSHSSSVEILEPKHLREEIIMDIKRNLEQY